MPLTVAYIETPRPTSGTANDDVALQHALSTRSPLLRKGNRWLRLALLSFTLFGRCAQRSSGLDYVALVGEIASRRGCGVNGGLTVIFFLGCMKSEKDILNLQSRRWSVATICRSGLLVYAL